MSSFDIRPLTESDIPRLAGVQAGFTSATVLDVQPLGEGIASGWRLVERELPVPFEKGGDYDFDRNEQANIRRRWRQGNGLHLIVEWNGRVAGILDVAPQEWNHTAWVWNIMLDEAIRGQGIGRALFNRAVAWARQMGYRALIFETQTNNVPACKFYARMGCRLDGIRTTYYSNDDIARGEVAIFWAYLIA